MKKDNLKNIARLTYVSEDLISQLNERIDIRCDIEDVKVSTPDSPEKQLLGLIFSPNPVTGFATSDLSVYLSEKTSPEVRDYIQKFLFNELPKVETMVQDEDIALDGTIPTTVQSPSDWQQVQAELVQVADLSAEQYKTWLLEQKGVE